MSNVKKSGGGGNTPACYKMGELQSIQFLAELSERLLKAGTDDRKTKETVAKIPLATVDAIATCHSVIDWLRPEEKATTTLGEAVALCVKLAGDDWRMRARRSGLFRRPKSMT